MAAGANAVRGKGLGASATAADGGAGGGDGGDGAPRVLMGCADGTVRLWDGVAGAVYPLGSDVKSVALAPRAGEVDVFAAVGKSFARLALRAGPSQLEARAKEELARRKSCVCLIS